MNLFEPINLNHIVFTLADALALCVFIFGWVGYTWYAEHKNSKIASLLNVMSNYRYLWMQEMLKRENRMMDATMVGNLLRSITFFANTTIFIVLGLMTMLGYQDRASGIISHIPFAEPTVGFMWDIKLFLLIVIFIYAFFKYTWSLRQYNYAGIFISAAPNCRERVEEHPELARKGATLVVNAARHFNNGLRAYYFGLAALAWFIHPLLLIMATFWVIFVIYRREFRSSTLLAFHDQK